MLDIQVKKKDALLAGQLIGTLDKELANQLMEFIEVNETEVESGFNRFCDLTYLEGINLSCEDVRLFATRRRAFNPNLVHVKSAFLADNPLALAIVILYQILLHSPRIEVEVFDSLEEAAKWLGVEPHKLKL